MPLRSAEDGVHRTFRRIASHQYLVFAIGGMEFGLEVREVKQCLRASDHPDSAVELYGHRYDKIDVRGLFGLPPSTSPDQKILAVESAQMRLALVVDAIIGLTTVEDAAVSPVPAALLGADRRRFKGVCRIGSRIITLIDFDGLLASRRVAGSPAGTSGSR